VTGEQVQYSTPALIPAQIHTIVADDGEQLALHHWPAAGAGAGAGATLFYVHGLQSHAGWLFETGPELAARGVEVFVLDRRGSGASGGVRGHLESADQVLRDYGTAVLRARQLAGDRPLTVLGQSFGGSVLAALVTRALIGADHLVFCAPALGQQRARHASGSAPALAALRQDGGLGRVPVTLTDADYTDSQPFLDFMANDALMVRQITRSTRAAMVHLEDVYMRGPRWAGLPTSTTVSFIRPEHDAIIDLEQAWRVLTSLTDRAVRLDVPDSRHYVEFSEGRSEYWDLVAAIALERR
jgi:alpha-beta hydrolase superfamily lysophospholipase